jgi:hypothetical protein
MSASLTTTSMECLRANCTNMTEADIKKELGGMSNDTLQEWLRKNCTDNVHDKRKKDENVSCITTLFKRQATIDSIPQDVLVQLILIEHLSVGEIMKMCEADKSMAKLCSDDRIWDRYFTRHPERIYSEFLEAVWYNKPRFYNLLWAHPHFEVAAKTSALRIYQDELLELVDATTQGALLQFTIGMVQGALLPCTIEAQELLYSLLTDQLMYLKTTVLQQHVIDLDEGKFGAIGSGYSKKKALSILLTYKEFHLKVEIQQYIIALDEKNFGTVESGYSKRWALADLLSCTIGDLKTVKLQKHVIALDKNNFGTEESGYSKQRALYYLLSSGMGGLETVEIQKHVIALDKNNFGAEGSRYSKQSALYDLVTVGLGDLTTFEIQKHVIDLPEKNFGDADSGYSKKEALYDLLSSGMGQLETVEIQQYVIDLHTSKFGAADSQYSKKRALSILVASGMEDVKVELQQHVTALDENNTAGRHSVFNRTVASRFIQLMAFGA